MQKEHAFNRLNEQDLLSDPKYKGSRYAIGRHQAKHPKK